MMPYGATIILVVVVLVVIVAVIVSLRRAERTTKSRLNGGLDSIVLRGTGTQASKPIALRAGRYRLDYQFSQEWATAVTLVSATSGDRDMLLYKTGSGSASFEVEADERVIVAVEPTADHVDWRLEIVYWAGAVPDVAAGPVG